MSRLKKESVHEESQRVSQESVVAEEDCFSRCEGRVHRS